MRDLAQVKKHLHGKTYKAARGQRSPFQHTSRRNDPGALRAVDGALFVDGGKTQARKLRAAGPDDVTRLLAAFVSAVGGYRLVRYVFAGRESSIYDGGRFEVSRSA